MPRKSKRACPIILFLGAFLGACIAPLLVSGASASAYAGIPEDSANTLELYQSLFPLFIESCGHSQIRMLPPGFSEIVKGNPFGHSTIYVKGLCRDMSEGYPLVKPCDELKDPRSGGDGGVGISGDYDYQNVSWTAVPDRHFFYWGDLKPGERFTRAVYLRTLARAKELGILDGIQLSSAVLSARPTGTSEEDFGWDDIYGTDFAVNVARTSACALLPITRSELQSLADYYNVLNRTAHAHGDPFNSISNNCTHTAHNALASIGFQNPLAVNLPTPIDLADLAIPFNEVVQVMRRGNELDLSDVFGLWQDEATRSWLMKQGRIPTEHGILMENWPIYAANDVYDTTTAPLFLELPWIDSVNRNFDKLKKNVSYSDLEQNLLAYRTRYREVIKNEPSSTPVVGLPAPEADLYLSFYHRYYTWVDDQLRDVQQKLSQLEDLKRVETP
jgi:hypothetical protein